MSLSSIYNASKDILVGGGKVALNATESGRGYIGIAALALAGLSTLGLAKALSPEAVADEADEFILNETLKTSLAKARQDNEILRRAKKLKEIQGANRLPHDRFV